MLEILYTPFIKAPKKKLQTAAAHSWVFYFALNIPEVAGGARVRLCDNLASSSCRFQTGKQNLISQQNSIRARTRPAISLLLLLIYIRTSAAPLRQPELNPREGGRSGEAALIPLLILLLICLSLIYRISRPFVLVPFDGIC